MGMGTGIGIVPVSSIHIIEAGVCGAGDSMDKFLPQLPKMVEGAIWECVCVCVCVCVHEDEQ